MLVFIALNVVGFTVEPRAAAVGSVSFADKSTSDSSVSFQAKSIDSSVSVGHKLMDSSVSFADKSTIDSSVSFQATSIDRSVSFGDTVIKSSESFETKSIDSSVSFRAKYEQCLCLPCRMLLDAQLSHESPRHDAQS